MFEVRDGVLIRYKGGYKKSLKIILPSEVKEIGKKAFKLTEFERENIRELKLSSIEIPSDIKLHEEAFWGTGPLKVDLLDGRLKVEKRSFLEMGKYGLNGTEHSELPDSIKYLGDYSLGNTKEQISKLPENIEYIGEKCIKLYGGRIKIPAKLKKMALNSILWECTNADLQGFDVDSENQYYKSDSNGWLYSKAGSELFYAYRLPSENNIIIPKGVKKIHKKGIYKYDEDLAPGDEVKIYCNLDLPSYG